jgi:predicted alpha/beta-fold hydrolase
MKERLLATGRYGPADLNGLRSVLELDDRITAPSFGFGNAANYYKTQSCGQFLPRIRIPALLVQARDDTFVPFASYENPALWQNPYVKLVVTERGGHLGFIARDRPRFWLDDVILDFLSSH